MKHRGLRRLIHASTALVLLVLVARPGAFQQTVWALTVLAVLTELLRFSSEGFNEWIRRSVPVFRPAEERRLSGATALWIGYSIAVLFPPTAATAGILAAALADPTASLVGGRWGSGPGKTNVGSLAVFIVVLVVTLGIGKHFVAAGVAAAAGTVVERLSGPIDDNFVVAPVVAAVFWEAVSRLSAMG